MGGKGSGPRPGGGNKSTRALQRALCPKAPDAETNAAILAFNRELFFLPAMESYSAAAVADRLAIYIDACERHGFKMQVNGASLALGMTREDLYNITHGKQASYRGTPIDPDAVELLRRFYVLLASAMETAINDSKANPVGQIFLAKNHFGYQSEIIHTTAQATTAPQLAAPDDVAKRYQVQAGRTPERLTSPE